MDKDIVHIYNGILLSHFKKTEITPFTATWMDLEIVIEWSKSDRERQIYDIAYMWNLKKGYKWTYLQNRNRVNRCRKQTCGYQGVRGGNG